MPTKNDKDRKQFDEDSDEENFNFDGRKIDELFKNYEGDSKELERITRFFEDGENNDCLICIRQMKSKDKIWSCTKCYCPFHLLCIQKWANDSILQKKIFQDNQPQGYYTNTGEYVAKKSVKIQWDCPQCRTNYETNEIPRHYFCYCGRERDPADQPFLIPHSCGEICNQKLGCGHKCRLLCHPGQCPSCPVVIQTSCKCKKSNLKSIRCSQGSWMCHQKCTKVLQCGHKCEQVCHEECSPCPKTSKVNCECGKQSKNVKCQDPHWSCESACGKKFPCQKHICEVKCHAGSCGECPNGLNQSCFCGKQTMTSVGCEKLVRESCGNTCLKTLACGTHKCLLRCHKGDCSNCLEVIKKKCRCGNIEKDFACSKELLCETKCKNIKSCKKHHCNRKCCVECLQCDKICSKSLNCGKHKCGALCHDGDCYPCTEKNTIKCRCTMTKAVVKCGKKNVKTPKCQQPCKFNNKQCHHEPIPHKCHQAADCPPCVQLCDEILPCKHRCPVKCHDNVRIVKKDKNYKPTIPGEFAEVKIEIMKLEHPPCNAKVSMSCLGNHVENEFLCYEAKIMSCGRKCGKLLKCGNHNCRLECHSVKEEEFDENCEECDQPCSFPRPGNCPHSCPRVNCHSGSCKKCHSMIKERCFCGLTEVYYRCCDVNKKNLADGEVAGLREKYLSCGSKCIKNYKCGHQCQSICHKGECPDANECRKKVKLICACKTRKCEFTCKQLRDDKITELECDENCVASKKQLEQEILNQKLKQRKLEDEKNRKELEEYEKKLGKKKYKERKTRVVNEAKDNKKMKIIIGLSLLFLLIAIFCGFYFYST